MVFGATGGIGNALTQDLSRNPNTQSIYAISRSPDKDNSPKVTTLQVDIDNENDIMGAAKAVKSSVGELHMVLIATGILHAGDEIKPEKTWRALDRDSMEVVFRVNAIGPALIAKHFLPLLAQKHIMLGKLDLV